VEASQDFESIHLRHDEIDDDDIVAGSTEMVDGRRAVRDTEGVVTNFLDEATEGLYDHRLIVDDQYPHTCQGATRSDMAMRSLSDRGLPSVLYCRRAPAGLRPAFSGRRRRGWPPR